MTLHLDVETYSECDLKKSGAYRYAEDPTTELLCFAYAFGDEPVQLWKPDEPLPERVVEHIRTGGTVRAHNAQFERIVLNGTAGQRVGFPRLEIGQMVCTAAKCRAMGLPGALANAATALGTRPKDDRGRIDMLTLSKPRTGQEKRWTPENAPERFANLYAYCINDVECEREIDHLLPNLSPREQRVYELDATINDRGVKVDLELVHSAIQMINEYKQRLAEECRTQTGYGPTQTGKLAEWVRAHGYPQLADLQVGTVNAAQRDGACPPEIRRLLRIFSLHNMKAVAKYDTMLKAVCSDGRLRGMFLYHGAGTGRWCLTGDHEVLTPSGWERLDTWRGGRLMCWHEASGGGGFESCAANEFDYDGEMVLWESKRFAQVATPDHKMPVVGHPGGLPVSGIHTKMRIPRAIHTTSSARYSEAELRFLVMIQADGSHTGKSWKLSFTKVRKEARCRALLRWLGLNFRYNHYPNNRPRTRFVFEIPFATNPKWIQVFGKDKTFGWEFLHADHDVFFDELEKWDGTRAGPNSIQYCTTNRQNADMVQAKAHIAGRQCNQVVKSAGRKSNWSPVYYCNVWLSDAPASTRAIQRTAVHHTGRVYCPSTPTGYFLVRRGGCCWITGNSSQIVQLQNLFRPVIKDVDTAIDLILDRDLDWLIEMYE